MLTDIKPGQWVTVKVVKEPRAEGHRQTLVRLCEKDPAMRKERTRLKAARVVKFHRRGGRPWAARPYRVATVCTCPGSTYKIFASVDVLRELKCVEKNVEVQPA